VEIEFREFKLGQRVVAIAISGIGLDQVLATYTAAVAVQSSRRTCTFEHFVSLECLRAPSAVFMKPLPPVPGLLSDL
jgi:hypothetical protein